MVLPGVRRCVPFKGGDPPRVDWGGGGHEWQAGTFAHRGWIPLARGAPNEPHIRVYV